MFTDIDSEVLGFRSRPETERLVKDKSSQTMDLQMSNQKTQTISAHSVASQASNVTLNFSENHPYENEKLLKFLKKILPHLEEELKNSRCSSGELSCFESFNVENFNDDGHQKFVQPCIQRRITPDFSKEKTISDLCWNSTDGVLAIACSEKNHISWCSHETLIGIYNTGKNQFTKCEPENLLKVSGCVRCIEFHNRIPSFLAGGLYSGEVIVWDLKQDDATLINKRRSGEEAAHVDVITFLTWRENENGLWLVSAGRDGRIVLWKVTITNLTYEVHERFLLLKQHIISTAGPREHLEIDHMDFRSSESLQFIAAGSGGTVFYCSLMTAQPLTTFPQYKDPVLQKYKPRQGFITCVSCQSDFFASCGTDSEIHIFKYEEAIPMMKIHTSYNMLLGIQWISSKELMSWGDSKVSHYRICNPNEENLICNVEGGVSAVAFRISKSVKNRKKLAIGNQVGGVLIFNDWNSA